jgi:hypothetical protein
MPFLQTSGLCHHNDGTPSTDLDLGLDKIASESPQNAIASARDAREYLDEYEAALEHHGAGVHRDPAAVLRDLRDAIGDTNNALYELNPAIARAALRS